nr:unnamed protein product [Spirometra erinaceieuropaei]
MQPARVKPVDAFDRRPLDKGLMPPNVATEHPDLSHLTPEERRIIEDVMSRQRQEELQNEQTVKSSANHIILPPISNDLKQTETGGYSNAHR